MRNKLMKAELFLHTVVSRVASTPLPKSQPRVIKQKDLLLNSF